MSRDAKTTLSVVTFVVLACCMIAAVGGIVAWVGLRSFSGTPTPFPLTLAALPATTLPQPTATASSSESGTLVKTPTKSPLVPVDTATPTRVIVETPTLAPTSTPAAGRGEAIVPPPDGLTTEERLLAIELPQRDVRALAERLAKTGPIPKVVYETPPVYTLGDAASFWVGNVDTTEHFSVTAVLRAVTPHLYAWVEDGLKYDQDALARSAENFEKNIYPVTRAFFGSEWSPGVDSDPHLHILHSSGEHMGASVAGYYSSADEYSRLANPYSNEREMFYISLNGAIPGTEFYDGVLAHEFQHMIHWANDRNEETWVNEGCSELAAYLNDYDPGGFEWLFQADPDVQLTTWSGLGEAAAHYGNSYLFMAYFTGRFGEEAMQRVVANPANGIAGFDQVLSSYELGFQDVFADWLIANYADNLASNMQEKFKYPDHVIGPVSVDVSHNQYPVQRSSTVHQYAADYIELNGTGDVAVSFSGDTQVRLVPANAHSEQRMWWANRGDDSDMTLTRAFDLRSLDRATLRVWMWYDIETNWDYGYVVLSTDGGQTWDVLTGSTSTTSDPNGNSFGPAYTGESGGWVEELFDLNPYVGQNVLLRFEYVTDDAINHPGWLIDDISIPELNYFDDGESGTGGWVSNGFVYSDNLVSQRYLVQVITLGQQMDVLTMELDEAQTGRVELRGLGDDISSAVLVVAAMAPVTTETASFEYTIESLD